MFESTGWILNESNVKVDDQIVLCQVYPKDKKTSNKQ